MRTKTATNFSFSSGDKKVDKTKQPEFWKGQEEALMTRYKKKVLAINPDSDMNDNFIKVGSLKPLMYEIGSDVETDHLEDLGL
jgi:hypothetical protein